MDYGNLQNSSKLHNSLFNHFFSPSYFLILNTILKTNLAGFCVVFLNFYTEKRKHFKLLKII